MALIRLITDQATIYSKSIQGNYLIHKQTFLSEIPKGKCVIVGFVEHILSSKFMPNIVREAIDNNIGIVYVCDALPSDAIVHENIIYIKVGWRWLFHTLFFNPLIFRGVFCAGKTQKIADAFHSFTQYKIPVIKSINAIKSFSTSVEEASNNILIELLGGFGDHLMTIPTLKTLHSKGKNISVLIEPAKQGVFDNLDFLNTIYTRRDQIDVSNFDNIHVLDFGQILNDYSIDLNKKNRIFAIAELCGINSNELVLDTPIIELSKAEEIEGLETWGNIKNSIFLGFDSHRDSSRIPLDKVQKIINSLYSKGLNVIVSTNRKYDFKNCLNLTGKLTIRQLFSLIYSVKYVLTVDSFTLHIAGAFNKQTWVLMTNFNPEWRTSTYNNMRIYTPKVDCFPCVYLSFTEPKNRKCEGVGSRCFNFFDYTKIVDDIESFIYKKPGFSGVLNKKILVRMPNGELGDKLVVLGLISELKRKYKDYTIDMFLASERYNTVNGYAKLFEDCVDNVYLKKEQFRGVLYEIIFEVSAYGIHTAELESTNKKYIQLSRYQRWAKQLGLSFRGKVNADYKVKETDWIRLSSSLDFSKLKKPIIGISPITSNKTKNLEDLVDGASNKWQKVINYLHSKKCTVIVLDPKELNYKHCINIGKLTPRELGYAVSKLDLLIGTEAGTTHFAGILNIPSLVLLGSSSSLVLRHYNNFRTVQKNGCIACNRFISPNFDNCKCGSLNTTPQSKCLTSLTHMDIINEIKYFKKQDFKKQYRIKL